MKIRTALLLTTAVACSANADDSLPGGQATLDDGRLRLSFDGGFVRVGVDPIVADGSITIDGVSLTQTGADSVEGSFVGGTLSYVLDRPEEASWFGRNLRLRIGYDRLRADDNSLNVTQGPDIATSLDVVSVSMDGRAYARSVSGPQIASAFAYLLSPSPVAMLACFDADGASGASASYPLGTGGLLACDATPSSATVKAFDSGSAPISRGASAAAFLLPNTFSTTHLAIRKNDLVRRGGFAGFAGDYEVSRGVTISPSVDIVAGSMRRSFRTVDVYADDLENATVSAGQYASGAVRVKDVGIRLGVDATFEASGGFDFFGAVSASLARRKSTLDIASGTSARILDEGTFAVVVVDGTDTVLHLADTKAAFGATLEAGAGYTFGQSLGIGPLRLSLAGAFSYDGDVPTYRNVNGGDLPVAPFLALAPGSLDYSDEATYAVKAALTVALP